MTIIIEKESNPLDTTVVADTECDVVAEDIDEIDFQTEFDPSYLDDDDDCFVIPDQPQVSDDEWENLSEDDEWDFSDPDDSDSM